MSKTVSCSTTMKIGVAVLAGFLFMGCSLTQKNISNYEKEKDIVSLIEIYTSNKTLKGRYWALKSISRLRDPSAMPYLLAGLDETHWILREEAAHALGELKDQKAVTALVKALNDPSILVRLEATSATIKIYKEKDTTTLEAALYNPNPNIRKKVAFILGCIKNNKSLPALLEAIDDPDLEVRQSVIAALAKFNDETAIELLISTLKDSRWEVRRLAALSLGKIGHIKAAESLKSMIKSDPNERVRLGSKHAMKQISKNVTESKCNRCHSYYQAISVKRTPEEWKEIIWDMMAKDKSWMNEKETVLITDYLVQYESILENAEEEDEHPYKGEMKSFTPAERNKLKEFIDALDANRDVAVPSH